jgi:hypothetical protein
MGHLSDMDVSYTEHFKQSMKYSGRSLKASFYFFIHAIAPDVFKTSGSDTIKSFRFRYV